MEKKKHSEETKRKMSIKRKEWYKNNPKKAKAKQKKMGLSRRGKKYEKISIKAKQRLSIPENNPNFNNKWDNQMKKRDSLRTKKLWENKEWREKVLKTQRNKKFRKKRSEIVRKNWQNPIIRKKMVEGIFKSWRIKPNIPEQQIIQIIKLNKLPFNYVGDGKVILNGFCPDFLSKNPKKIIELFGEYHHNLPLVKKRDKRRLRAYKSLGYETLIIWCKELKNPQKVTEKIINFC